MAFALSLILLFLSGVDNWDVNVFVIIDDGTVFRAIGFIGLEEEEAVAAAILLSYTEHILLGVLPSAATKKCPV